MSSSDESRKPIGSEQGRVALEAEKGADGRPEASAGADEPVPRLPRGRGLSLSVPEILRIAMFLALLIAVVTLRQPCADSAGRFVESFEPPDETAPAQVEPAQVELPPGKYIRLTGEMSEEEIRQKIESLAAEGAEGAAEDASAEQAPAGDAALP